MSEEWLPPRRRRAHDEPHYGEPTPATAEEHSREPSLRDLPSDDETVRALTSSTPPTMAEPLPPLDDNEFVTPPVIHDLVRLHDPARANAELAAAAPAKSQDQRIADLESKVLNQGNQIENLRDMFKIYLYGKSL